MSIDMFVLLLFQHFEIYIRRLQTICILLLDMIVFFCRRPFPDQSCINSGKRKGHEIPHVLMKYLPNNHNEIWKIAMRNWSIFMKSCVMFDDKK